MLCSRRKQMPDVSAEIFRYRTSKVHQPEFIANVL